MKNCLSLFYFPSEEVAKSNKRIKVGSGGTWFIGVFIKLAQWLLVYRGRLPTAGMCGVPGQVGAVL